MIWHQTGFPAQDDPGDAEATAQLALFPGVDAGTMHHGPLAEFIDHEAAHPYSVTLRGDGAVAYRFAVDVAVFPDSDALIEAEGQVWTGCSCGDRNSRRSRQPTPQPREAAADTERPSPMT